MSALDPLTAAPDAIPRRVHGAPLRLGDVARVFGRRDSPKLIAAAFAAALAARLSVGHWSWRDAVIPAALIAFEPLTEWLIHVYLLHARPIAIGARRYDLLAAREHRAHHADPGELDGVLVPTYALLIFLPAIAVILLALSFPVHLLVGGDRLAWWLSGVVVGYSILFSYEWCHFLIHSPYRPRGRYYKVIWRNHRLHHFKNERYWFGVTSNLGDVILRTNPEQSSVAKSRTARALGDDEVGSAAPSA
ncbi:MAG: sterol desaturase family protein [Actinomycetota bacterium]|nr:sterol desaturase family protein [Actinomycetota bacterium]